MTITFAIGDVHGCRDELASMIALIESFYPHDRYPNRRIIFVGDYIDRGPESKGVIDIVRALQKEAYPCERFEEVVALKGNHEDMLIDAHRDPESWSIWMRNGGNDTLRSFEDDIPEDYMEWINRLPLYYEDDLRFYCHAGVVREPLSSNSKNVLLWVRNEFLYNPQPWSKYIVHGHTPLSGSKPDQRPNRINLDTALVFGGFLSCAVFDDSKAQPIDLLQVKKPPRKN